jgi:hypothetical protein
MKNDAPIFLIFFFSLSVWMMLRYLRQKASSVFHHDSHKQDGYQTSTPGDPIMQPQAPTRIAFRYKPINPVMLDGFDSELEQQRNQTVSLASVSTPLYRPNNPYAAITEARQNAMTVNFLRQEASCSAEFPAYPVDERG